MFWDDSRWSELPFNLSDEAVVERCSDSPNFQYFSGQAHFEPRLPCDATTQVKFRRLLGEEGCEELLAQTINQALSMKRIPEAALATVVVDSTVQEEDNSLLQQRAPPRSGPPPACAGGQDCGRRSQAELC